MFDNTITLHVNGSDRVLTRVNQDKFSSNYRYRNAAINLDLTIRHSDRPVQGKVGIRMERHNVEVTVTEFATVDGVLVASTSKAYFVFECETGHPTGGITDALLAMNAEFAVDTAALLRLVNWES